MNEKKEENELNEKNINHELNQDNLETKEIVEDIIEDKNSNIIENDGKINSQTVEEVVSEEIEELITEPVEQVVQVNDIIIETSSIQEIENTQQNQQNSNFDAFMMNQQLSQKNNMGIAGFVLSILAIFLFWFPIINWILVILGFIFSIIGMKKKPKGLATAGFVISTITLLGMLYTIFVIAAAVTSAINNQI